MIPILYDSNETAFTSNGLARLRDCISCRCYEERNGVYEVDFEYPVTGVNFDKIELGRIIGVTHEDSDDIQPFDIVSYTKPINGIVTFHCVHISYRQSKMVTYASDIYTIEDAFRAFGTVFFPSMPLGFDSAGNPFVYSTDKDSSAYCAAFDGTPKTIRSLLGGSEGSILDTYGGEYEWDRWDVILHKERGEQKDFVIRYGVNLADFQDETDCSESYNSCVPYWRGEDAIIMGGEVYSGQDTVGSGDKCVPLDLSDKFEEQPTVADLESMAAEMMNSNQTYLPSQNITVDFVRLQDEAGSDAFDTLMQCKLCDSIKVIFPGYDMSAYYKIVKTVWNVLLDRYDEMELGNLSTSLSQALGVSSSNSSSYVGGGGGGGGATALSELTDVSINSPTNRQVLIYDTSLGKWKNGVSDGTTYSFSVTQHVLTMTGSDGSSASVVLPDDNTTYSLMASGLDLMMIPSVGQAQTVSINAVRDVRVNGTSCVTENVAGLWPAGVNNWGLIMGREASGSPTTHFVEISFDGTNFYKMPEIRDNYIERSFLPEVTTTARGAMSAADKVKLDSLTSGVSDVQMNGTSVVSNGVANLTNFSGGSGTSANNKAGLVPQPPVLAETGAVRLLSDAYGWIDVYPEPDSNLPLASQAFVANAIAAAKEQVYEKQFTTYYNGTFSASGFMYIYYITPTNASDVTSENAMKIEAFYRSETSDHTVYPLIVTGCSVSSTRMAVYVKSIYGWSFSSTTAQYLPAGYVYFRAPFEIKSITAGM